MEFQLTKQEKEILLKLARDTIAEYLKSGSRVLLPEAKGVLGEECGAFVTLHRNGRLRGCIGNMVGHSPLVETIREMAIHASTGDPRFQPVKLEEMENIDIEISVLGPLEEIDDVNKIQVGTHGILMSRGMYSGVLLPQVATEYGWDRETFLEETCHKAGLPADAWKDPATKIQIFAAEVFGEKRRR